MPTLCKQLLRPNHAKDGNPVGGPLPNASLAVTWGSELELLSDTRASPAGRREASVPTQTYSSNIGTWR